VAHCLAAQLASTLRVTLFCGRNAYLEHYVKEWYSVDYDKRTPLEI